MMIHFYTRQIIGNQMTGALEDGRVEIGGIQRDPDTQALKGAGFLRCRDEEDARNVVEMLDTMPSLEGRVIRAKFSDYGIFSAKPEKIEQFPIGTIRPAGMLLECPQDIIDVNKRNDGLVQRAVNYFVGDKIVCKDFDQVIRLQREANCRNIVTLDGVEFKQGMISGGTSSQNVFNLNLGQFELDKDIKKLSDQIKKLVDKLDGLKG